MSNIGLEIALREAGIDMVRCPVGDKYVMEEMMRRDLSLGGEQSGHVIFSDYLFTGDGLATSLNVLRTMAATGRELADLASELTTYPQVLMNLRVRAESRPEDRSRSGRRDVGGRVAARRQRPAARALLRHRAAAARDARRTGRRPRSAQWGQEIIDAVKQHVGIRNDQLPNPRLPMLWELEFGIWALM